MISLQPGVASGKLWHVGNDMMAGEGHLGELAHKADAGFAIGLELLVDALLAVIVVREGLRDGARLVPQAVVQEEAVHERAQQRRAHQMPQPQLLQLRPRHKPARNLLPSSISVSPPHWSSRGPSLK